MRGMWFGVVMCIIGAVSPLHALEDAYPLIKTTTGVTYKNCTVTKVEPDAITLIHSDGAAKIPFDQLSPELQKKYHYDPKLAEKYIAEKIAKREEQLNRMLKANPDATISSITAPAKPAAVVIPPQPPRPANRLTRAEVHKIAQMLGIDPSADTVPTRTYANGDYVRDAEARQAEATRRSMGFWGDLGGAAQYAEELKKRDVSLAENRFLDNVIKAASLAGSNAPDEFRRLISEIKDYIRLVDL